MSQTYDPTKPISGDPGTGTPMSGWFQIMRDHFEAVRTGFSGTAFPTDPTPVEGQRASRTDEHKYYIYNGTAFKEIAVSGVGLGAEIENARGTKPTMDQRFDVAHNEDGTLKAETTLNPSQWHEPSLTFTYVNTTTFTVNGDQTDIYKPTRRLKVNLTASTAYSEVVSPTYNSGPDTTSVLILDAVLGATLVSVEHSILLPAADNGALTLKMLLTSNQLVGAIGAATVSGGTADWDHVTNARSGNGYRLLRGNDTNGPTSGTEYYHPFCFEFSTKDGSGNLTQLAIPYIVAAGTFMWARSRYGGTWSDWFVVGGGGAASWTNIASYGTGWSEETNGAYKKSSSNQVDLAGLLKGSALALGTTTVFTLPSGFRPSQILHFPRRAQDLTGATWSLLSIDTDGAVSFGTGEAGHNWYLFLDGLSFPAA